MDPAGTIGTAKTTNPIPVPRSLPAAVHSTARTGFATLQEQMRLEHDGPTFAKIVKLIRRTAARHVSLTLSYIWQDPQLLDKIKQEVLSQCPLLSEVYVDAWPITSYLRMALKEHKTAGYRPKEGRKHKNGRLKKSSKSPLNRRAYVTATSRQGTQKPQDMAKVSGTAAFPVSTTGVRRATGRSNSPSEEAVEDILELSDSGCESDNDHVRSLPSNTSGSSRSEIFEAGAETKSLNGTEGSSQDSENQNARSDYHSDFIRYCIPDQEPPSNTVYPESPRPSAAKTTRTTSDTVGKNRTRARLPSVHPLAIRDMFIARGLPVAGARRVALLLSSLGIVDVAGLRVFSRLTVCETWISEMLQKGSLSELEARVIRDVLDSVRETK